MRLVVNKNSTADNSQVIEVIDNLQTVKSKIAAAARGAGRTAEDIVLVAISKGHGADRVRAAVAAGHLLFGENRVQEAAVKFRELRDELSDLSLHMVGPLQTNKARQAVALFDVIQSLDRPKLAAALAREMDRCGRRPICFIEVNTGDEKQKSGVSLDGADQFIEECRSEYGLPIAGLMCIPPAEDEPSLHFALLRQLAVRNELAALSMGMSRDYEVSVAFGATHVRVGTAIFGRRPGVASPHRVAD
jgi:pyridoxal phosphate enzyme (YggS family)